MTAVNQRPRLPKGRPRRRVSARSASDGADAPVPARGRFPPRGRSPAGGASGASTAIAPAAPSIDQEPVADAPHRLEIDGVRGIGLDLTPEAGNLDVHRPLARAVAAAGKLLAGDVGAAAGPEDCQDLALALRDADDLLAPAQLAAVQAEGERAEADRLGGAGLRRALGRDRAPEDVAEAQDQLPRLEGFGEVVVGPDLQPVRALGR